MTCPKGRQWRNHSWSHDLLEVAPRVDSILLSSPWSHMQRITFLMESKNKSSVYFCQLLNAIVAPVSSKPKTFYFYGFIWKRLRILPQWPREWTVHCGEYFDTGNTTNWLGLIKYYSIGRALTEVPFLKYNCSLSATSTKATHGGFASCAQRLLCSLFSFLDLAKFNDGAKSIFFFNFQGRQHWQGCVF